MRILAAGSANFFPVGNLQYWALLISRSINFRIKVLNRSISYLSLPSVGSTECGKELNSITCAALLPALFCHIRRFLLVLCLQNCITISSTELEMFHLKGIFYCLSFVWIKYCIFILLLCTEIACWNSRPNIAQCLCNCLNSHCIQLVLCNIKDSSKNHPKFSGFM